MQTGQIYYTIRAVIPKSELDRIVHLLVSAGMQADVYLQTGEGTAMSYLMKPVQDQFARAFRER